MDALVEKTAEPQQQTIVCRKFHLQMAFACLLLLVITAVGMWYTSIRVSVSGKIIAMVALSAMLAPLPLYWHEKGRIALRESTVVIWWEVLLAIVIPLTVLVAARLRLPLQDHLLGRADSALGVSVPGVMAWAGRHWLGRAINWSYAQLLPLLAIAAFLPALTGRVKYAREFLVANLIAFVVGISLFALFPAIGPWFYYHVTPNPEQFRCQMSLATLRFPGVYISSESAGIICFPSFHAIWAVLCAATLWSFRALRIPVCVLSSMILISTLTTGWHYFVDVIAGVLIAFVSLAIARRLCLVEENRGCSQ